MRAKNTLTAADAARVEAAFHSKLSALEAEPDAARDNTADAVLECAQQRSDLSARTALSPTDPARESSSDPPATHVSGAIDKGALAFPEPRRVRDKAHLRYLAKQPCLVCGRSPCDPHHLRFAQSRALGRKASDEFTVPLCRGHHRELHRCGDETACWKKLGIDPIPAARALWLKTHPIKEVASVPLKEALGSRNDANANPVHHRRHSDKRATNTETKPIVPAANQP